jgi:hypothetical protein
MHLLPLGIEFYGIRSEQLVKISNIGWPANVPRFVDKIETVGAGLSLGTYRLLAGQKNEGKK